ncbi:RNA polymerase sigma-70 factor, ECF subfamily [uncultured Sphingopyxis sp.]|uniref:RNA polymerase sigma-70 factor, ECF subfamily n=1 Tax=uncultured Sphingopyxis sp. TaxID=310581 RepID=A0A1Y5PRW3_9SPHN|nr:sigma-70 family RNA polymerase sigma factor [uncultured Sphingopyxis sp.]SBV32742.1 RNA polymerase sigma-70 factor, ECF subfamily [uncultured Sphingopyxis sp.]
MITRLLALPFQINPVAFSSFSRDRSARALPLSTSDRIEEPEKSVDISAAARTPNDGSAALDRAFRNDGAVLLRYLGRHVGPEAAPDLMQEVFLRAAGSEQRHRLANPAAFLQRIARNLLINRAVSRRRNKIVLLPLQDDHDVATPPQQELEMEAADLLRLYERAITGLSEKTRRVFLMHRVEELSYREIHRRLGISIATVEYHMMKALAHIAQVVDPIDE